MKVLIVGCGKVGSTIAEQLCADGHEVMVLDTNAFQMAEATENNDIMGVVGDATNSRALIEAGIRQADLLCAVTGSDEKNLLCCLIARQLSDCRLVARVRNPIYNEEVDIFRSAFDLTMVINPELTAASEISRVFHFPSAVAINTFAKGRMELLTVRLKEEDPMCGRTLAQIRSRSHFDVLICLVERKGEVFVPSGDFVLEGGDLISLVADQKNAAGFFGAMGIVTNPVKSVIIAGGSKISYYLAKMLLQSGIRVKIIEIDKDRCEELADEIPEAQIICADSTNSEVLMEEGIGEVGGFAALTGLDEANIMLSVFAESKNTVGAKIVTKINRKSLIRIIDRMDLDTIINPKSLTAEGILQHIRSLDETDSAVENLYRLADGRVEALEFSIKKESRATGKSLAELKIRKNVLIAKIYRSGELITPGGSTVLQVGDSVVVVARSEDKLSRIDDILK